MAENDAMNEKRIDAFRYRAVLVKPTVDAYHIDAAGIGARIRFIREGRLKVTQSFFAERLLGITGDNAKANVSSWENGRALPDIETLSRIAMLGHMSIDTLVTGVERITPLLDKLDGAAAACKSLPMSHPYSTLFIDPIARYTGGIDDMRLYADMCESGREMEKKRGKTRGKTAPPAK